VARAATLLGVALALLLLPALRCAQSEAAGVAATIAGERFQLELAADPATRFRGLSGRSRIAPNGGMLFAFRPAQPLAFLMRDCPIPIDIAFLDGAGRVLAVHAMRVEPPRAPGESGGEYEARLPLYESGVAAQFAIEVAGGRLAELGLAPGDRVEFDRAAILARTR
jgi:hypothetical protein